MTLEQLNAILGLLGYFDSYADELIKHPNGDITVKWTLWGEAKENRYSPKGGAIE
jgi:hypothetical protein